jgi:hypothetical protein
MTAKYFCGHIIMTHLCIDLVASLSGRHENIQKYSKFRQTGSGDAADLKLSYTIQFSILMLCAKYQEAGLCGS